MSGSLLDPIVAFQTISPAVGVAAALAAWPTWRVASHAIDALHRRLGDIPVVACATLLLVTAGFMPTGLALAVALGQGAGFVSAHFNRPRCTVERFKPDGTSAGMLFIDGPCPTDRKP